MRFTLPFFVVALFFGCLSPCLSAEEIQWKLQHGKGELVPPDIVQVTGNGTDTAIWNSQPIPMTPGYYRYSVSLRGIDSEGGILPCGIEGLARDYQAQRSRWIDESFCFRTQDTIDSARLRLGQWESKGTFQFRNPKLEPVVPIYKEFDIPFGQVWLGEGETVRDAKYEFRGNFGGKNSIVHRPLHEVNAVFNSNRWCFTENSHVTYRFDLTIAQPLLTIPLTDGKLTIHCNHYVGGVGVIEISSNNEQWTELAKINKEETQELTLPASMFPADNLLVRIRGLRNSNFQVDKIDFVTSLPETADGVDVRSLNLQGETLFAVTERSQPNVLMVLTQNNTIKAMDIRKENRAAAKTIPLEKSRSPETKTHTFEFGGQTYSLDTQTHPLERSDYGYRIGEDWWCEADWKVSRDRQPPEKTAAPKPITISAAKNDVEGFQYIIRADKAIAGLTGRVTELKGPDGVVIPKENVELLYVYYHFVHSKTDETGLVGDWPDALPPLNQPIDIPAGKNQPIWINIKVPTDAAAGNYQGTFRLASADGKIDVTVPYTLHVWNFALPKENHFETAYGYNAHQAAQYHNAVTDEDRRKVSEMYLQSFSDHRISIYRPAPFDDFRVRWLPQENPPRCEVNFSRYEAEMDRVLEKFNFTNFTVPGQGLGGGTFHSRSVPSIAGFAEDTPEYKAMIADYYSKLESFLVEKGWIDKAYIYWFDEPGHHDYEYVAEGTAKIQQYAPKIQRFMTLMMDNDGFMKALDAENTSINIWCSISNSFREELAKQRVALGERFWWYICTGPKAPYCTLFIDHPATELRVWHWQAWQRNIVGALVWESTYWNSTTAFPNSFQNPYEDPMGYTVGYSVPSGTKVHWGNGDGRFIYPPLSAAVPGMEEGEPIFDKPVSSIRWEMIREGVEDYEMLYLLRELLAQKGNQLSAEVRKSAVELLTVPESITKSMTEFTIDPRPMLERRGAVAAMIEQLQSP